MSFVVIKAFWWKYMYETITTNIMVENVKETIEFYQSKLGFQKVLSVPEDGSILDKFFSNFNFIF